MMYAQKEPFISRPDICYKKMDWILSVSELKIDQDISTTLGKNIPKPTLVFRSVELTCQGSL